MPENVGSYSPDESPISVAQFSIGSHSSAVPASNVHSLISARKSCGRLVAYADDHRMEAKTQNGVLTFIPAGMDQRYEFEGDTTNIALTISEKVFQQVIDSNTGFASSGVLEPRIPWIRPALNRLVSDSFDLLHEQKFGWKTLTEANALMLAVELLASFGHQSKRKVSSTRLSENEISTVVAFIEDHLDENFGLSTLAKLLDRDVFGFSRAFKNATGSTPHQFVIHRRLEFAKDRLLNTNETLGAIAYDCGFSSQAHFTAAFSKQLGVSPGTFRSSAK
ncbi:MAG: AraC family transcriptional regulator [Pseudomonadota bacterium]